MDGSAFIKLKDPEGVKAIQYLAKHEAPSVGVLFAQMLRIMDKTNGLLAQHDELAKGCDCGVTTIKKAVKRLEELKFIQCRRTGHGKFYFINGSLATRMSKRMEMYAGMELWTCKVLVKPLDEVRKA